MRERGALFVLVMMLWAATAAPAFAHAERFESVPDEGARLKAPPASMKIDFTEPPIGNATFQVVDGCGRDVVEGIEVQGTEIAASLAEGQPGEWAVHTHVVSGIDGHATQDRWSFKVAGTPDCAAHPADVATGDDAGPEAEGRGPFLLLAFAGGTVVVIAVALALRRKAS